MIYQIRGEKMKNTTKKIPKEKKQKEKDSLVRANKAYEYYCMFSKVQIHTSKSTVVH